MTIGELRVLYQDNHVRNLKTWLQIRRRLQRYIAPFDALESVAPVRLALDDQAERMLGPVPVVAPEPMLQEWPG